MSPQKPLFTSNEWAKLVSRLDIPPQQAAVLKGLIDGLGDKQIAERLALRVPTVRAYLTRLYARAGVQDRTSMVVHAFRAFREINKT